MRLNSRRFGPISPMTRFCFVALLVLVTSEHVHAQRVVSLGGEGGPVEWCLKEVEPNRTRGCSGGIFTKMPFTDVEFFDQYAGDLAVGNVIAFSFGGDGANLYSELVGANLHLGVLGLARAGFGALVAASEDSTVSTADQFFDGGGNASFYIALPLFYHLSAVRGRTGAAFLSRRLDTYFVTSIGADLPALNAAAAERATMIQFGPQVTWLQNATDDALRLFVQVSGGYAVASSQFFTNAGVNPTDLPSSFLYGQATFGVELNKLLRVGGSIGTSTVDEISRPLQLSVQLLPQRK
jgi:hypothetical protein